MSSPVDLWPINFQDLVLVKTIASADERRRVRLLRRADNLYQFAAQRLDDEEEYGQQYSVWRLEGQLSGLYPALELAETEARRTYGWIDHTVHGDWIALRPSIKSHPSVLKVYALAKTYPNGTLALDGVDLEVGPGEIVGVVGGSGCGKSTLLRLAAGLDVPSAGSLRLNGEAITAPRAEIGVVFQEPRLMPWLKIAENVGFGIRHLPAAERERRVAETLARVGLADAARRWPRELSGGMAQRAALARALVAKPSVLLLDEPFSALDALTRADLQDHLLELWSYDRPTMVLVTHDIEEALVLADRVLVMRGKPGRVQSAVSPHLARPRDRASSEFQSWKQRLLAELHSSARASQTAEDANPAAAI